MAAGLYNFQTNIIFIYLTIYFVLGNIADPNEMQQSVAFHLDLQCLPMYPCLGVSTNNISGIYARIQKVLSEGVQL